MNGLPFAIHLSSPQKFWEGLCNAAGHPELIDDPRFRTNGDRMKNLAALTPLVLLLDDLHAAGAVDGQQRLVREDVDEPRRAAARTHAELSP